ncbi:MAG: hypothetical protein ACI4EN_02740 [Butyrivibrio sp.]
MIYTSKRRKLKDFVRTHNWKYYILFLILFITVITTVIIIASRNNDRKSSETTSAAIESFGLSPSSDEPVYSVKGRYRICVNTSTNLISIYEWDGSEYSSNAVKCMTAVLCPNLKTGEYTFDDTSLIKSIWYSSSGVYYRYLSNFDNKIIFHSAEYEVNNDKNSLNVNSYDGLVNVYNNRPAQSDFGIVLLCSDAKWIYENCSYASEIVIFSEAETNVQPSTPVIPIPNGLTWDPTDDSNGSPYCQTKLKSLNCTIEQAKTTVGAGSDFLLQFVKAFDESGKDVSSYAYTTFKGNFNKPGTFEVEFLIADIYGSVLSDTIKVNVNEPETSHEPETTVEQETTAEPESSKEQESQEEDSSSNPTTPAESESEYESASESESESEAYTEESGEI